MRLRYPILFFSISVLLAGVWLVPAYAQAPNLQLQSVTIDDSGGNNNGTIDPNECVNLTITLINNGASSATGVTGTLVSNTTGVTVIQSTSAYPDIPATGTGANVTPYQVSIDATFVCGTAIDLTLNVTSNEGTFQIAVSLQAGLTPASTFSATGPVPVPDNDPNGATLAIPVSGLTGTVAKVTADIYLTQTWDGDFDISLIGPNSASIDLSSDNGGDGDNYGTDCPTTDGNDTIFDDAAATPITAGSAPFVGTFSPEVPLSTFNGIDPNGTWTLKVVDDFLDEIGNIECWSINIQTISCTDGGGICLACTYADNFNDGVLTFVVVKPNVTEASGFLNLTPAGRKAIATSDPVFAGCSTCTITTTMQFSGGVGAKGWLLTHRIDKNNQIEIIFKQDTGKVIVREKFGGQVKQKVKASFAITPNTNYQVQASYDGTTYTLKIDGATIITMTPTASLSPGIFGYQSKNQTTLVDDVCVN